MFAENTEHDCWLMCLLICQIQATYGYFSIIRNLGLERHLLTFNQITNTRGNHHSFMDENIFFTYVRLNKSKPFGRVKPLNGSIMHNTASIADCANTQQVRYCSLILIDQRTLQFVQRDSERKNLPRW